MPKKEAVEQKWEDTFAGSLGISEERFESIKKAAFPIVIGCNKKSEVLLRIQAHEEFSELERLFLAFHCGAMVV